MTERKERIEHILQDLAAEPVQARDEFKQRLITTLLQEQRNISQARTGWRQRLDDIFSQQMRSRWLRPAASLAFVAALLVLVLGGIFISWTLQRPFLTLHQGVAHISSQKSLAPKLQQRPGDVVSVAEGTLITMDDDSTASLSLFDDNKVELFAGTQLTLTQVQPRSMWQAQMVRLQMTTGQVKVQASPLRSPNDRFEVDMPAALVSVRGTVFHVEVVSPQHIRVATYEGVVVVTLHDPSQDNPQIEVPAGYQVDAIIGRPFELGEIPTPTSTPEPEVTQAQNETSQSSVLPTDGSVTLTLTSRPGTTVTASPEVTTNTPTTQPGNEGGTITATPTPTPTGTLPPSDPPRPPSADLEIEIDAPNLTAAEGVLTYTLRVFNHGPNNARQVVVDSVLPPQVRLVSPTLSLMEERNVQTTTATLEWELGTIAAENESVVQMVVMVHPWVTQSFTNTAVVTAATVDTNPGNNQAVLETTLTDAADLAIFAEVPAVTRAGSVVTCILDYANFGPAATHNITIVIQLPVEMSFGGIVGAESLFSPFVLAGQSPATWTAPELAAGASGRIVFTATVQPGVLGYLTSTVVITSSSPDGNWDNNDCDPVTLVEPVADVAITQSVAPDPVVVGGELTYTLVYTNRGPWAAEDVFITATLPLGVILTGQVSSDLAVLPQTGRSLRWFAPSLLPGTSGTVVLTVKVDRGAAGPLRDRVVIRSATRDGYPGDNAVAGSVDVLVPALSVRQTVQPGIVARHQPCTFTLYITNTGAVVFPAQSLLLVETLPSGFYPVSIDATQPVTLAQRWTWRNFAPLAPGESVSVSRVVLASGTVLPGLYPSTAGVMAAVPGSPIAVTTPASVRLALPSVAVTQQMIGDGTDLVASDRVTLTVRLSNTGPSPLAALPLTVRHDPHVLHFVSAAPSPEKAFGDGTVSWRNLIQSGIGRDLFPGKILTVTLAFDVTRPVTEVNSIESYVTVGELRDSYGNLSDGYTIRGSRVQPLYLPVLIRSS